jgi:hypothetical protein
VRFSAIKFSNSNQNAILDNDGCFTHSDDTINVKAVTGSDVGLLRSLLTLNAKNYNSIYGKTSTVQSPAIKTLIAIRY